MSRSAWLASVASPVGTRAAAVARFAVAAASAIVIVGLTAVLVANPIYLESALDRAGSARILGLSPAATHALSASVVLELVVGPGTFAQTVTRSGGPTERFFDPAEASHLGDVRVLVVLLLLAFVASLAVLAAAAWPARGRTWFWRAVAGGAGALAAGLALGGLFFLVAFDAAFTLFHLVAFPGGNWQFDPLRERMVQLYPTPFWQEVTVVFALVALGMAGATWWLARRRAGVLEGRRA